MKHIKILSKTLYRKSIGILVNKLVNKSNTRIFRGVKLKLLKWAASMFSKQLQRLKIQYEI